MAKPGPKPDPVRAHMRREFGEWSDRTFASWWLAFRQLGELADLGFISDEQRRQIMALAVRPNGSINVSKFAQVASDLAALYVAGLERAEAS